MRVEIRGAATPLQTELSSGRAFEFLLDATEIVPAAAHGKLEVRLSDSQARVSSYPVTVEAPQAGDVVGPLEIVAVQAVTVEVHVTDRSGPVSGARVFIEEQGPERVVDLREAISTTHSLAANAEGVVRFAARPGRYAFCASAPAGPWGETTEVVVEADASPRVVRLSVRQGASPAVLVAVDDDGKPVPGAWLLVERAYWTAARAAVASGDVPRAREAGAFTADPLVLVGSDRAGRFPLHWLSPRGVPLRVAVGSPRHGIVGAGVHTTASEEQRVTLSPLRNVGVRLTRLARAGLSEVAVDLACAYLDAPPYDLDANDPVVTLAEILSEPLAERAASPGTWSVHVASGRAFELRFQVGKVGLLARIPKDFTRGRDPLQWEAEAPLGRFVRLRAVGAPRAHRLRLDPQPALEVARGALRIDVPPLDWHPHQDETLESWWPQAVLGLVPRRHVAHVALADPAPIDLPASGGVVEVDVSAPDGVPLTLEARAGGRALDRAGIRFSLQRLDVPAGTPPTRTVRFDASEPGGRAHLYVPPGEYAVTVQHFQLRGHKSLVLRGTAPTTVHVDVK